MYSCFEDNTIGMVNWQEVFNSSLVRRILTTKCLEKFNIWLYLGVNMLIVQEVQDIPDTRVGEFQN